jgi:hypothetical protein
VAQRFPEDRPDPVTAALRGIALVEAGRLEDAERILRTAERQLDLWGEELANAARLSDEELASLQEQEQLLRAARVKLGRALEKARREEAADGGSLSRDSAPAAQVAEQRAA